MTTLVVVALDNVTLRLEDDSPRAPQCLLVIAELTQAHLERCRPEIERALADLAVYGYCELEILP